MVLVNLFIPIPISQWNTLSLQHIPIQISKNRMTLTTKDGQCRDHKNPAELICLHEECGSRLMCMLCEHHHELFTSVRATNVVDWGRFRKVVDQSIDRSLRIIDDIQRGGIEKEKILVAQYYLKLKQDLSKFIDLRMNENLAIFNANSNSSLQFLIRARIEGRYHELTGEQFGKIKQVYQGKNLEEIAQQEQQSNLENAYKYMQQFHQECEQLFTRFKIPLKIKVPEIRIKEELNPTRHINVDSYSDQIFKPKQKQNIKYISNEDIPMMVTDGYSGKGEILMVGYDKMLRVFDKSLKMVAVKEFGNVITRVQAIGQGVFALGVSKELHIVRISADDGYEAKQILVLKGHTERIWDISAFNTRIVGSCSEEGSKIWDLYKQKCQYTLREQINPSCLKFMPSPNLLAIGYHNHSLKIYSISTMKPSRSYQLPGVPLYMAQENRNENVIYCGGFQSDLMLFDVRVAREVFVHRFGSEAVTTFKESIFEEETLLVGERGGKARTFDLRKLKTRLQWQAHPKTTNLSKPNGVVRIFQQGFNQVLTIGSNDRKAIIWELKNQE